MYGQLSHYYRQRKRFIAFLGGKCVICGTDENLEFHHKDPNKKSFNVGKHYSYSFAKIKNELLKCELRCKLHHLNAHQAKHGNGRLYAKGCRCAVCVAAFKEKSKIYMQTYRKKRKLNRSVA